MTTRNDDPPNHAEPPDHPVTEIDIHAKQVDGVWEIHCPQWRCTLHDRNLTKVVALLLSAIETHNES